MKDILLKKLKKEGQNIIREKRKVYCNVLFNKQT